jgi:hypothetical protein
MTVKIWLDNATHDAERRGLPALRPLLETLARSTSALRTADWNFDATGNSDSATHGSNLSTDLSAGASAKAEAPSAKSDLSAEARSAKSDLSAEAPSAEADGR